MKFRMNGTVYEGTAEEVVEAIRQGWMWSPIPSITEFFRLSSELLKTKITTAQGYVDAMVKNGLGKIEPGTAEVVPHGQTTS